LYSSDVRVKRENTRDSWGSAQSKYKRDCETLGTADIHGDRLKDAKATATMQNRASHAVSNKAMGQSACADSVSIYPIVFGLDRPPFAAASEDASFRKSTLELRSSSLSAAPLAPLHILAAWAHANGRCVYSLTALSLAFSHPISGEILRGSACSSVVVCLLEGDAHQAFAANFVYKELWRMILEVRR
jgi:hypothetical protein